MKCVYFRVADYAKRSIIALILLSCIDVVCKVNPLTLLNKIMNEILDKIILPIETRQGL